MALGRLTMPLRDHFRPPLDDFRSWDELHGAWPTVIVMALNRNLPSRYVAAPRVHLGPHGEIDVTAYDSDTPDSAGAKTGTVNGGVATAVWAPPRPTFDVAIDMPEQDEYGRWYLLTPSGIAGLVAAVEDHQSGEQGLAGTSPSLRGYRLHFCSNSTFPSRLSIWPRRLIQPVLGFARVPGPGRFGAGAPAAGRLRRRLPLGARGGCLALPGVEPHPRSRSAAADTTTLACRQPGRAARAGSDLL